ncbi:hypothetical protein [Aquimarina macrocephali]|uniref:hypothetical protein n=1 Tax=Aquimarina macrocephali TaxID=666563 RepID=UPI003F66AC67
MKKVKLKKIRITKLTNVEKLSVKGGYSGDCLPSHYPPCHVETGDDDCRDSKGLDLLR